MSIEAVEYLTAAEKSPFGDWFRKLDATAAAKVVIAISRLEAGNVSNVKSVGQGVHEYRIHFGPGYRVYFGTDGDTLIILLAGGSKQRQHRDIADAQARSADYKRRKKESR